MVPGLCVTDGKYFHQLVLRTNWRTLSQGLHLLPLL